MTQSPTKTNDMAERFVTAFMSQPQGALIKNAATSLDLHDWGEARLPISINSGELNRTFLCSPKVAWVDYTLEELAHFPNSRLIPLLRLIVGGLNRTASVCDLDRIVHVNNWMVSTNLPSNIDPSLAPAQTAGLVERFPGHIIAMRSLTQRQSGALMGALGAAGWLFLPSRQVFIVDDVKTQSLPRRDARNDARLWDQKQIAYEQLTKMTRTDAERISVLYRMLYLEKYSLLNPQFTPQFVHMAHEIGLLKFLALRDDDGTIQAFGGMLENGRDGAMPLLGYNTGMDQAAGLYRLACHAGSLYAAQHDLRLNMSSGVGRYKSTRGATPEIEYTAFFVRHLPRKRRWPFAILQAVGKYVGVPLLKRYTL